ncbi:MAG: eukaryotic-like serine/threonine-protein kinase, partial [Blastocatellia bacterium]|nr:eukaryotic-like serine/threonine-protein kinase [Blastocatellia bacterium]
MLAPDTILQTRYRVVRSIGQGGMGAVYMATDLRLRSTVALKETLFHDEKLRRAFEHEAELLANLHHPALPSVSDHFIEGEGQFLVMQFIQGEDLFELLKEKNGPFPVDEVLNWADQLLDALDYLHTQDPQVIHRDIKPQNLKLTARGQIILLDFGLAKGTPLQVSRVTTSGSIFGYTPNYAPLEQIHGTGTDARSDLYSLAATLYALLTGGPPPDALSR